MIAAIIQARMGSTRLPGKTLAGISGAPMLWHVVQRARAIPGVEDVFLATSGKARDDVIVAFAAAHNLRAYRGSEEDVLDRMYQAARRFRVDTIVRVTPDCPLLDPAVAGRVVNRYSQEGGALDYVSNVHPPTFPDGLDTEVIRFEALACAWQEARLPSEREHVTPYLWKNERRFRIANVTNDPDLSHLRWTVDTPADLAFVRKVYERLDTGGRPFGMLSVLDLLAAEPALMKLAPAVARNEGYLRLLHTEARSVSG